MDDQRPLGYHQATLDLLHERPSVSEDAVDMLEQFSSISNLVLPASVREWYTLPHAVTWLSTYSNQDYPVPLDLLGDIDGFGEDAVDLAQQGVIPIMVENQNVCIWALRLNDTKDPPVVVSLAQLPGGKRTLRVSPPLSTSGSGIIKVFSQILPCGEMRLFLQMSCLSCRPISRKNCKH